MSPAPAEGADPALDELLGRLAGGSLLLTDGQGAISKWSDSADLLFGRSAEAVLGRSFFAALIAAPLAPAGEGWRRYLEAGEPPGARARVELDALHASGEAFAVELVFIPVRLEEGFEFSLFLEDLAFALPAEQLTARLRAQHPVVMRALRAALSDAVPAWEGGRTAGTLIAFRPLVPVPWVAAEHAARERAAAAAATASADLGPEEAVADFPDAGRVVERLLAAVHRLDALEAAVTELPRALEARLAALEAAPRVDVSALEARVARLEGPAARELRDAVRTAVRVAQGAADRAAAGAAVDAAEAALDHVRSRVDGVERQVAGLDGRAAAVATSLEEVQSLTAERAAGADARFAELRAELTGVLATVESFRSGFEEARQAALAARRDADHARASAAAAGTATQRSARQLSSAWRELLSPGGADPGDLDVRALPSRAAPAPPPARAPREGFDDQAAPMAVLGLDGHFREINAAFEQLVGYPEHEFRQAVWPSAHDRGAYREQQEQLAAFAAGALESVRLRSTYMHGQGLMVPVTGRISAVRGEDGQPAHLLLRAEERASR